MASDLLGRRDKLVRVGEYLGDGVGDNLAALLRICDHWQALVLDPVGDLVAEVDAEAVVEGDRFVQSDLESVLVNNLDFSAGVDLARLGRPGGLALDLLLQLVDRVSFIDLKHKAPPE